MDRKIEFGFPDKRQKRLIYQTITQNMNLADDVDLEVLVNKNQQVTGAEINAICQEAGMQAVRKNQYIINQRNFEKAFKMVMSRSKRDYLFYK